MELAKYLSKLAEVLINGGDVQEVLGPLNEFLQGSGSRYSILYLLLINMRDELKLSPEDVVTYFIRSHEGLVTCFKEVLKAWVDNQHKLIEYLESIGAAEHPLANVFIVSEVLGLIDPLNPEAYVLRGNLYLNYLRILKEYESMSGYQLRVQMERAFKNALELYTKALNIDVNYCDAYVGLARLYKLVENLDQAITNYENALRCRYSEDVARELTEAYKVKESIDKYST